jgi:uncharacterized protein (DUF983 family)
MLLISCPQCGVTILSANQVCPVCHAKLGHTRPALSAVIMVLQGIGLLLMLVSFVAWFVGELDVPPLPLSVGAGLFLAGHIIKHWGKQ